MTKAPASRDYSIVLLGATGDAGRAIAAILASRAPASVRWAIAGRSEGKLRKAAADLQERHGVLPDVLLADCASAKQLETLASKTSVLISAAGPYVKLGEAVVAACIQSGTHYVDITGEVYWVADMKAKYRRLAADAGVCLCSFAGYDCIPVELSITTCAAAAREPLTHVECVSVLADGGFPHGTIMTMLTMCTLSGSALHARGIFNFVPQSERMRTGLSLLRWLLPLRWSDATRCFTVPHGMGTVNIPVVHNTAASLGFGSVVFSDRQVLPELGIRSSPLTLWGLLPVTLLLGCVALAAVPLFCLWLLLSFSTSAVARVEKLLSNYSYPGSKNAYIRILTTAHAASGAVVRAEFVCPGDAGIWGTGKLAAETALSIVSRLDSLPVGFVTPGALGDPLVAHLRQSGVQLSTTVVPKA